MISVLVTEKNTYLRDKRKSIRFHSAYEVLLFSSISGLSNALLCQQPAGETDEIEEQGDISHLRYEDHGQRQH